MWKRILLPVDFSPCAERAIEVARALAKTHGSSILLLHVSELPENLSAKSYIESGGGHEVLPVAEAVNRGALRELEALASRLRREGLSVETMAKAGPVVEQVLDVAAEHRADVLVVGTHGRSGISHLLLGSVAEKLVRSSSVPVVTVRTPSKEATLTSEERDVQDELDG